MITQLIEKVREEYIQNNLASNFQQINCGLCVDFAEDIERLISCQSLTNDHFVTENEHDGWFGDGNDNWNEYWLEEYHSLPPANINIDDLGKIILGYHQWIYYEGKHYDSECPEGVENFFELPFFKRQLETDLS